MYDRLARVHMAQEVDRIGHKVSTFFAKYKPHWPVLSLNWYVLNDRAERKQNKRELRESNFIVLANRAWQMRAPLNSFYTYE